MLFGVIGGFAEPISRRAVSHLTSLIGMTTMAQLKQDASEKKTLVANTDGKRDGNESPDSTNANVSNEKVASIVVESNKSAKTDNTHPQTQVYNEKEVLKVVNQATANLLCTLCYLMSAALLMVPYLVEKDSPYAFSICLGAFLLYELLVGMYIPCEGVIRSMYMPNESICSLMNMMRVVVNVAVAIGVISTNYIKFTTAFGVLSGMMIVAAFLQLSLVIDEDGKKLKAMVQEVDGYASCCRGNSRDCKEYLIKKNC